MRLLNTQTYQLQTFTCADTTPDYAILSHCWDDDEVTFADIQDLASARSRPSWKKLEGACAAARDRGHDWLWIDTCCIDKSSSAELSEAIISMFTWCGRAALCLAYLVDAEDDDPRAENSSFRRSRWFTRGWTLQELIAPGRAVLFLSRDWKHIGSSVDLAALLAEITKIDSAVLLSEKPSREIYKLSVAMRMAWAAGRATTRPEDRAYSLMGLFNVTIPIFYGEGREKAFRRLQLEIIRHTFDHSIFAWGPRASLPHTVLSPERRKWNLPDTLCPQRTPEATPDESKRPDAPSIGALFAPSPDDFRDSADVERVSVSVITNALGLERIEEPHFSDTNMGVRVRVPLCPVLSTAHGRVWCAALACRGSKAGEGTEGTEPPTDFVGLMLYRPHNSRAFLVIDSLDAGTHQLQDASAAPSSRVVNVPCLMVARRFPSFWWRTGWMVETIYIWADEEVPDPSPPKTILPHRKVLISVRSVVG